MEFIPAIKKCLSDWITFSGRAQRSEYWWFALFLFLLYIVVIMVAAVFFGGLVFLGAGDLPGFVGITLGIVALIFFVYLYIAAISVGVRRLHDRNMSGWWMGASVILGLVPYGLAFLGASTASIFVSYVSLAFSLFLLVVLIIRGTDGPNRYGEDPLGGGITAEIFE